MFAGAGTNSIAALKNTVLPDMMSTVIKAKFKGTRDEKALYVANICAPRTPMVSGMPSIVNIDENNICSIIVENCAPYDVTLERDDIIGVMETEQDELVPLTDDFISSVCQDIHNCFPKVKRKRLSREEIRRRCHLQVPEEFHERYLDILCKHQDALSINKYDLGLEKCVFGNKEVSYLGFTLTPDGIKLGKNKLKAIKDAISKNKLKAIKDADIKTIRSFVGLCNFFRTHIKDFALIAAPLIKLTRKDSGYKSGQLPEKALKAFYILQKQLTSEPVMAFPKSDGQYALITDAATGTADTPGGLGPS
jgi:hypothetical protein